MYSKKGLDKPNLVRYTPNMKTWKPGDIKGLRKRLNLSQVALAERLGVSGNYVYLLEKGVKEPSKTLRLLLDCIEKEKGREVKKYGKRHL